MKILNAFVLVIVMSLVLGRQTREDDASDLLSMNVEALAGNVRLAWACCAEPNGMCYSSGTILTGFELCEVAD